MGKLRKRIMKTVKRQFREKGLPMLQYAILTGIRTAGNELSRSNTLRSQTPDVLFGSIASAFRNGVAAAGRELLNAGMDYIRTDSTANAALPLQPADAVAGTEPETGFDSGAEERA